MPEKSHNSALLSSVSPPVSALPSRRSLRESQRQSQQRQQHRHHQRQQQKKQQRPRWAVARALTLVVIPAVFGTFALPAFGSDAGGPTANLLIQSTAETQSLTVASGVAGVAVERDGYSATSTEELAATRAAAVAAEAAKNLKTSASSGSSGNPRSGIAPSTFDAGELAAFLAGTSTSWQRPVAASPTSAYGPRAIVCNGAGCSNSFHDGVDMGTSCGTPIKAVSAGRVTFVGSAGSYGNRVIVDHGGGISSIYGHVQNGSYSVQAGDLIEGGTTLASVGATGVVTACVLDLKITVDGSFTDPVPFLANRGVNL